MAIYKRRTTYIEAKRWTGDNIDEIEDFAGAFVYFNFNTDPISLRVTTLKGDVNVSIGDFIIKGTKGEFYPVEPDIFHEIYEIVEE